MNPIFQEEKDILKRGHLIEAGAYTKEQTILRRPYSPGELQQFKDEYCLLMEHFSDAEEELKELSQPLKEKMKAIKAQAKEFMQKLKKKYEPIDAHVFGFDDQDQGIMNFYDINGEFISSRKLTPDERQFKLKASNE